MDFRVSRKIGARPPDAGTRVCGETFQSPGSVVFRARLKSGEHRARLTLFERT